MSLTVNSQPYRLVWHESIRQQQLAGNALRGTDILLRHDNENLFIAECKFWKGQSQYKDAVSQLLNNLTVRDTHASLLVFSRRNRYSQMVDRVEEATKEHEKFETQLSEFADHNIYRFQTSSRNSVKVGLKTFDLLE